MLDYEVTTYTTTTIVTTETQTITTTHTETITTTVTNTVETTITEMVAATGATKLSDLGVNSGEISIYSYANGAQTITISSDDTIDDLVAKLPGASFSDGKLNLDGVKIVSDGTTSLTSALGLTETTSGGSNVFKSGALYYTSTGASATTPPASDFDGFLEEITRRDTSEMTALADVDDTATISSGTYSISTTEELVKLATMTNSGKVTGGEFVLANNIDLSSIENWTPIGADSKSFKGTFDGNGYTVSNMKSSSSRVYVGFFGDVDYALIKNLNLSNVDVISTMTYNSGYLGGVVGAAFKSSIVNCNVSGNINATGYNQCVGGIAGGIIDSTIANCNVSGNIFSESGYKQCIGGLVGNIDCSAASDVSITNCSIYSTITVNSTSYRFYSGGVAGFASVGSIDLSSVNVYCSGGSQINARFVDIVSYQSSITIENSKYNRKLSSSLKDYGLEGAQAYTLSGATVGDSVAVFDKTSFMNPVTKRDTSEMTALAERNETYGISSGTYSISTTEELVKLATMTNSGNVTGGEFVLANDIDLSSIDDWTPIGAIGKPFKGTFDGNGYTVSNMKIDSYHYFTGFFGTVSLCTIKNLSLSNIDIKSNFSDLVGGLIGENDGNNTIQINNCNIDGKISVGSGTAVGGIIGQDIHSRVRIKDCNTNIDITTSFNCKVGGIVGNVYNVSSFDSFNIENCNVFGDINKSATSNGVYSGGVIGVLTGYSKLYGVNIYSDPYASDMNARFVGLCCDKNLELTLENSTYNAGFSSLPDYYGSGYLNATGTSSVNPDFYPPTYYKPIGGNTTKAILNAWDDPSAVKLVNLTDSAGKNLGITAGTLLLNNNGVDSTYTITNETTLADFIAQLGAIAEQDSDGALKLIISGISSLSDGTSNLVSKLFGNSQITGQTFGTQSSDLQTTNITTGLGPVTTTIVTTNTIPIETTITTTVSTTNTTSSTSTVAIDGSTKLADISNDRLPSRWTLNMKDLNGQNVSRIINISSSETFDSLISKLNSIDGITAYLEDGNKFTIFADPNKYSSIDFDDDMSEYLALNKLFIGDSSGLLFSSKELKTKQLVTTTSRISAANYADESVKLSDLNITSGTFTLFNDEVHKTITIDKDETIAQLKERVQDTFSDICFEINDGVISIYSTNNKNVFVGSHVDSSNIASILNFKSDEETNGVVSQTPKYMVSENSVVTKSGLFRAGNVTVGTFKVGGAEINIDENTTISDIISQINYSDKSQAMAYWDSINGELVITSKVTGAFYIDIESVSSNFTDILGYTKLDGGVKKLEAASQEVGKNAIFSINGTRFVSTSNTITSAVSGIEGLTINLKDVTEDETVTIKVEKDKDTPANAIEDVVEAYNELIENVDKEVARTGNLSDQSALKLIRNQLRSLMTSAIPTTSVYKTLSAIGIKTEAARSGNISTTSIHKLSFDKDRFKEAFMADSDGVKTLLVGTDGQEGIFTQLENVVESSLQSVSGYFDSAANSYSKKIKRYNDKINKLDSAAERYKSLLERKFQSMEMLISKLQNSYSSFLGT